MPNIRNTVDIGVWNGQAGDIKHAITVSEWNRNPNTVVAIITQAMLGCSYHILAPRAIPTSVNR
jgi:hypothetical protein